MQRAEGREEDELAKSVSALMQRNETSKRDADNGRDEDRHAPDRGSSSTEPQAVRYCASSRNCGRSDPAEWSREGQNNASGIDEHALLHHNRIRHCRDGTQTERQAYSYPSREERGDRSGRETVRDRHECKHGYAMNQRKRICQRLHGPPSEDQINRPTLRALGKGAVNFPQRDPFLRRRSSIGEVSRRLATSRRASSHIAVQDADDLASEGTTAFLECQRCR